jgi:serine-type D-Ala-D-Ala carboxypeptidase (penicillin-binding protein 5/6)
MLRTSHSRDAARCYRSHWVRLIPLWFAMLVPSATQARPSFDTSAPTAVLIDFETGTVLLDKDADRAVPPASLTKLMTIEVR